MHESYLRWQEMSVKNALETRRILILAGSRQCGKTTLARMLSVDHSIYRTLDDLTLLRAAQADPQGFVRHGNELMIIDEIQRIPDLLQAIKQDVDDNQRPGRFLLTGSANIQSLPTVKESLAGRSRKIHLRPLAVGEIYGNPPRFIAQAFAGKFYPAKPQAGSQKIPKDQNGKYDKDSYLSYAMRGGYPEARKLNSDKAMRSWHKDYLQAMIERDLKDITNIRRKEAMMKMIQVLAAWSAKFMDIASICKSLALARPTVDSYINALETLYLIERVKPWHKTDYGRIGKQEKIFMTDSGMMTAILKWRFDQIRFNGEINGKLIETFVFNQLAAILDAQEDDYALYHYRDREKREVDFVVEDPDGALLGIEVKAGSAVDKSMFKHLQWFARHMAKDKPFKGIVLYTGEHAVSFGDNLWAVPISCLWS